MRYIIRELKRLPDQAIQLSSVSTLDETTQIRTDLGTMDELAATKLVSRQIQRADMVEYVYPRRTVVYDYDLFLDVVRETSEFRGE